MSQSTVKATRRDLRRAIGTDALTVFQSNEQLIGLLQNAVETTQREQQLQRGAHKELIASFDRTIADVGLAIDLAVEPLTRGFLGRLRWLVTGR